MKKFYALTSAGILLVAGAVFAEDDDNNMLEFDLESVVQGALSFDKSKTPGKAADNDTELSLNLNYARQMMNMPKIQLGGNLNYLKDTDDAGDQESYGFMVGAIYNMNEDNLKTSPYASLYTGLNWNRVYGGPGGDDEVWTWVAALGKRVSLEPWGMKHLTYSPEIAFKTQNSTNGGDLEYAQSLEFRFLQFAVFF